MTSALHSAVPQPLGAFDWVPAQRLHWACIAAAANCAACQLSAALSLHVQLFISYKYSCLQRLQ